MPKAYFVFFFLLLLRWENHRQTYAQAEKDRKQRLEKEFASLEKEHKNIIDSMGKASDAEKGRCRAGLEQV